MFSLVVHSHVFGTKNPLEETPCWKLTGGIYFGRRVEDDGSGVGVWLASIFLHHLPLLWSFSVSKNHVADSEFFVGELAGLNEPRLLCNITICRVPDLSEPNNA